MPRPPILADVIIKGNGMTLYHVTRHGAFSSHEDNFIEVRLWENEWHKNEAQFRGDVPMTDLTTREDIMAVLQNVESVLVRASYDQYLVESSLLNLELDTALLANTTALEQAALVEKCTCPPGYSGSSCEMCTEGYGRQQKLIGERIGRCIALSRPCICNGHSNDCDPRSGECRGCRDNTDGRSCERCARGFYGDPTKGFPDDCRTCPCPFINPSNQ